MITDSRNRALWETPFEAIGGRTPHEAISGAADSRYSFEDYIKGDYGERMLAHLLPWLNFGADENEMAPELLEYWRERGIIKERHEMPDPDRTWISYMPVKHGSSPLPVWYVNHAKGRDRLDLEAWGFVQLAAREGFAVITAEDGNSEEIFEETLAAAAKKYPLDLGRVYLAGHSLSGSCAGRIACAYPEKLAGLCMIGAQYCGYDSTDEQLDCVRALRLPRVDIHGTRESRGILPYNVQPERPKSPQIFANITPTGMDMADSFIEQQLWRGINRCPMFEREAMENIQQTSYNTVEQKLGVPLENTKTLILGSVAHYMGDACDESGRAMMRIVGVEGAPHYPTAFAAAIAWEFLRDFARDTKTGELITL